MKAKRHMVEISDKNEELVAFAETIREEVKKL